MSRLLLCTDLDRTLLPNGEAPESPRARERFAALAAQPEVTLVYVTGRDANLVDDALAAYGLPEPRVLIGDVGASIAWREEGSWRPWGDWRAHLAAAWDGRDGEEVRELLTGVAGLALQEPSRQGPHKASFVTAADADLVVVRATVVALLAAAGLDANVICSVDEAAGRGLVDVLPPVATKRLAIEYVMHELDHARHEVLFAGDSGNDLDVLVSGLPSVLVANAAPAVREAARAGAAAAGQAGALHLATGGVLGLNGNYAAGILEGVAHFHPDWAVFLQETT